MYAHFNAALSPSPSLSLPPSLPLLPSPSLSLTLSLTLSLSLSLYTEPPDPPTEVNGVILGSYNNSALISWLSSSKGPCPITRYLLQLRRTDSGTKTWTQVADDITSTAHVVENLERGVAYVFRVCAMNEVGCGRFSQPSPPLTITDEPGGWVCPLFGLGCVRLRECARALWHIYYNLCASNNCVTHCRGLSANL